MSTQKPKILPTSWANSADPNDVTQPDQAKIESGWVWGEKPKHQEFNWGWKVIDDYTHHVNSHGVPAWDDTTTYEIGSVVLYNPFLYQATIQNTNVEPPGTSGEWELIGQTLEHLSDTNITSPVNGDVLAYDSATSLWTNIPFTNITSQIKMGNLVDVELDSPAVEEVLGYNGDKEVWENMSINEAMSRDAVSTFTLVKDVQYKTPNEYDVLKYDGNIWKIAPNIMAGTDWGKLLNPPNEFPPPFADASTLGGGKVYCLGSTLYIETAPTGLPNPPEEVSTTSDPSFVDVFWIPPTKGERGVYYKVYRNSELVQGGIYDNIFTDETTERDREYIYYVTSWNKYGESTESNKVVGHTFSEPSKPRNLSFQIKVNDVYLDWEEPEIISGDIVYYIYRNNIKIAESDITSYVDPSVPVGSYTYFVTANNKYYGSENSNTVLVVKQ